MNKNKSEEKVPPLEITEVVLVHCNIANNDYLHDSRVLYTFIPNKLYGRLLDISPKKLIILKTLLEIQNFHILKFGLQIEILNHLRSNINTNITLVIN